MGNVHRKRQGAVQMSHNCLKILFIGNSHTYYNDMPSLVKQSFEAEGYGCHVTMLAHPGWFLAQHVEDPEAKFNILYGGYDYVVLQEHAHPFGPEEKFYDAVRILTGWIKKAGSTPVIYLTWAKKSEPEAQDRMTAAHSRIADETGSLLAHVGDTWWSYMRSWPDLEMYAGDGEHASPAGSDFAAKMIMSEILQDLSRKQVTGKLSKSMFQKPPLPISSIIRIG